MPEKNSIQESGMPAIPQMLMVRLFLNAGDQLIWKLFLQKDCCPLIRKVANSEFFPLRRIRKNQMGKKMNTCRSTMAIHFHSVMMHAHSEEKEILMSGQTLASLTSIPLELQNSNPSSIHYILML